MGYETHFYGRLNFSRDLNDSELAWVEEVINADHAEITPEMADILNTEREARRIPGCASMFHGPDEASRRMELLGFIAPKGPPGYIDYAITEDRKGLEYAKTEKSYTMIEGLNFVIANARQRIPDFHLTGQMFARTEFEPYDWVILIGKDGWAEQVPCDQSVVERARLTQAFDGPKPKYAKELRSTADELTIVNRDSEVFRARRCLLVQERCAGVSIEVGNGYIFDNGHMDLTLRMDEAKALSRSLSRWVREDRIWRAMPKPARSVWQRYRNWRERRSEL